MNFEKIADFVNSTINEIYEEMQNNPDEFLEKTQKEIKKEIKNMKNTRAAVIAWQMLENAKNDFILKNPDFFQDKKVTK